MACKSALAAAVLLLASGLSAWATDRTWTGANSTTWNQANNWLGSAIPGVNDRAIIPSVPTGGRMPTIGNSPTIGQIQIQTGATVTVSGGQTLTLNGTTTGGGSTSPVIQGPGVFAGTGTVTITGGTNGGIAISTSTTLPNFNFALTTAGNTLGIASGVTVTVAGNVNVSAGSLQVGDAVGAASTLDINGNLTVAGTLGMRAANSNLTLTGNLNFSGTFTPGTSTVTLDGTANMTMTLANANYQFYNLTILKDTNTNNQIDGDLVTPNNGFTVNGNLAITRGQFQVGAFTVTVNGNVTSGLATQSQLDFTNTGVFRVRGNCDLGSLSQINTQVGGPYATIQLDGTTVQTFQLHATTASAYFDLDQLQISNPAGVIVLDNPNADFTVNGQLTIDAGCSLTVRDVFDPESPLVMGANSTLRLENIVSPDSTIMGSTFTTGVGSTVVYAGQGIAQTVYTQQNNGTQIQYHNLTIDNTGVVATQQAANTLAVLGNFAITANGNFTSSANGMVVSQSFIDNGTFTHNGGTVTMNGTGSISGTAASLIFNNLTINGALTTDVVTAARSFTTNNLYRVLNGSLTTAGAATPITMTALQNVSVGDAVGAAGTAVFNLRGTDTLALAATRSFTVVADGRFTSLGNAPFTNGPTGNPTLTRTGATGNFTTDIGGQVNLMGLNFSFGGTNGLYLHNATIERLRNVRFTNILAGNGSHHLTIDTATALDLDCPGCMFDTVTAPSGGVPTQYNVFATGAAHRLRFELRSTSNAAGSIGGPGAGESFDGDDDTNDNGVIAAPETVTATFDGSIVQWVYTANIDMTGALQGFPEPAFDWNTFAYYSTYMVMRQTAGSSDIIYVADANGDLKGYSFSPGAAAGNIVGPLFWDTEAGSAHVVYFGTTTGLVYKLVDNGSSLSFAPAPWNTPYSDTTSLQYVATPIMSDQTNLYFGGNDNFNPGNSTSHWGMYRLAIATKTQPIGSINFQRSALNHAASWADTVGGRMIFQATGLATNGTSQICRIRTSTWALDTAVNSTGAFNGPTNVPIDTLFVGEATGRVHAVSALGTTAQFVERTGFPFVVNLSAVNGGIVWEPVNITRQPTLLGGRLAFGAANGDIYLLYLYPATWTLNTNYYKITPAGNSVQSMPLLQDGRLYVSNSNGRLFVFDADTGAGPALSTTYNLFGNAVATDVSRDAINNRIFVGTSGARMYAITPPADPTPTFP